MTRARGSRSVAASIARFLHILVVRAPQHELATVPQLEGIVFKWLSAASAQVHEGPPPVRTVRLTDEQLLAQIQEVSDRVQRLERREGEREADHQAMLDSLARLYKRVSTRIAREHQAESEHIGPANDEVSPAFLRKVR